MDTLAAAWLNVQWMVYNWISNWWNAVDGNIRSIQQIGQ